MATGSDIILRLTLTDPVPGVSYSLQTKQNQAVGAVVAGADPLSFDVPVRVADGPRFLGQFVRSEGPSRRFIYIAIGKMAGDATSPFERRAKIDIHTLSSALLEQALTGSVLEARLPGRAADGGPACATIMPIDDWQAVARRPDI